MYLYRRLQLIDPSAPVQLLAESPSTGGRRSGPQRGRGGRRWRLAGRGGGAAGGGGGGSRGGTEAQRAAAATRGAGRRRGGRRRRLAGRDGGAAGGGGGSRGVAEARRAAAWHAGRDGGAAGGGGGSRGGTEARRAAAAARRAGRGEAGGGGGSRGVAEARRAAAAARGAGRRRGGRRRRLAGRGGGEAGGASRRLRSFTVRANYRTLPEFASTRLDTLELSTPKFSQDGPGLGLLRDAALIGSLRDLTLRGGFRDWTSFASAPKLLSQLRSLSLLKAAELNPVCLALLPRFSALERLSVGLSSFQCFTALAGALPAVPALRSLFLSVSTSSHRPESNQAAGRTAVAVLLRAARDTLEEYDRDHLYPSEEESGALAACTRLRRASLTLAEPAEAVAAGNLAALAPLASVAARPAPARGDLELVRRSGDASDWGDRDLQPLLGARWLLV
eukprot:tig00000473_g1212.t1